MIRIILAEDHHLVRQGIRALLDAAPDIVVVAEADNGRDAVNLVRELTPDVLVTDINMPRMNGIQAAEQIRELDLSTQVIILSMHADPTLVRQALRYGVKGYLLKRSLTDELLLGVRAAARGETFLCPGVSDLVMSDFLAVPARSDSANDFDQLSAREREILKLVAEGHTNKAIAEMMHVSIKTVEKHRANLMAKLDVQDLAGLIRVALKHRLIFLDE
jgi:DNA-binding NarL/FixJ family response regulator